MEARLHRLGIETMGKRNRATQEQTVADIECRASVISRQTQQRVRRKIARATRVAVGVTQRIVAEDAESRAHADVEAGNQLVLLEDSVRLVLVDRRGIRDQRIGVEGKKLVYSPRVQIGDGKRRAPGKLALH